MLFKPAAIKSTLIYLILTLGLSVIILEAGEKAFGGLLAWIFAVNIVLFSVMAKDKFSAIIKFGRTPEGTLLWLAFAGAFPALFLARFLFNHKTTKVEFQRPMWIMLILQILALIYYAIM